MNAVTHVIFGLGLLTAAGMVLLLVAGFARSILLDHNAESRAARAGTWPVREGRPTYVPPAVFDPTLFAGSWSPERDERPVVVEVTVSNVPAGEIGGAR